jgi:asparagine synthase (glutamine-hydrolysing)
LFAAIFNADRKPVDLAAMGLAVEHCQLLGSARHVALLRSRAPFAGRDRETSAIRQIGDALWIVGRIRLDGRHESADDDALFCLQAYARWGESFLDHLAGDFCFVLWDGARGRLIGARDQLGIRSLFHAHVGGTWVLGDSLDWIKSWRALSRELDDCWVADFLTARRSLEFDRTIYREVRRLPPAHLVGISDKGAETRRYWHLAIDEPLYLRDRRLYGERFRELTLRAVADRLPASGRVGISLSGGLDSTTLAASAVELRGDPATVVGLTFRTAHPAPDDELSYAREAARHLGIELGESVIDDPAHAADWRAAALPAAEPDPGVLESAHAGRVAASQAAAAPVWLQGEGPDNALKFERGPYLSWLARQRRWGRLIEAGLLYARAKGLHGWGPTWRRYLQPRSEPQRATGTLPAWLSDDFVRRLDLHHRAQALRAQNPPAHPWHPWAMASFADPIWQAVFAECDVDEMRADFVWRHPFLDLRVLQFMLSLPPLPWTRRKLVIREAMRGRLPAAILARDKTPSAGDGPAPVGAPAPPLLMPDAMKRWIDLDRFAAARATGDVRALVPILALDFWLASRPNGQARG